MEPISKPKVAAGVFAVLVCACTVVGAFAGGKAAPKSLPSLKPLCRQADAAKATGDASTARRLYVACLQAAPKGPDAAAARRGLEGIPDLDP